MPNLNALDNIGDNAEQELNKLLFSVVNTALEQYEDRLRLDDIDVRNLYLTESREIVLEGMLKSTTLGLKQAYVIPSIESVGKYYLNAEYFGSTLSNRLYRDAQRAQRTTTAVVQQHLKARTTWQRLAKDIRTKVVTVDDLPQYLLDVQDAFDKYGATSKTFQKALNKAERQIAKFTNKNGITRSNLTRAYSDVVKAAARGDDALLKKKMTIAVDKKAINNSERLSRSELSRAYSESEIRRMLDDPDILGKRFVLSPSHPRPDECDFHAEVDSFGMGGGISPVGQGTPLPAHSRCICMYEDVLRTDKNRVGRFSNARTEDYLKGLSEEKRSSILGKKNANDIENWSKNLNGYEGVQDLTALPSELVVKK
jgi:hypothetical protein